VKSGVITESEGEKLSAAHEAVARVVEVDDFAPATLSPIYRQHHADSAPQTAADRDSSPMAAT